MEGRSEECGGVRRRTVFPGFARRDVPRSSGEYTPDGHYTQGYTQALRTTPSGPSRIRGGRSDVPLTRNAPTVDIRPFPLSMAHRLLAARSEVREGQCHRPSRSPENLRRDVVGVAERVRRVSDDETVSMVKRFVREERLRVGREQPFDPLPAAREDRQHIVTPRSV